MEKPSLPVWEIDTPEEYRFGMNGTKWRIFCCAVHYFAEADYSGISMRQLADEVGIRASSIYNHFPSKDAILDTMFGYIEHYSRTFMPDLDELLALVDSLPPREVLRRTHFRYPEAMQSIMAKAILVSAKGMRCDARANACLKWMLIDSPTHYATALLNRMLEKGRIRPLDVEAFTELYTNNFYGAAMRMYSSHPVPGEMWDRAFVLLFDVLEPI